MKDSLHFARSRIQLYNKGSIDLITCSLMFVHYLTGLIAFDFISDFEEWVMMSQDKHAVTNIFI